MIPRWQPLRLFRFFWCGWKTCSISFLSQDLWLQLFFAHTAFSISCPILLVTFETSVRLSWLKKTFPWEIHDRCQPEPLYIAVYNCTLSTGEDCHSETVQPYRYSSFCCRPIKTLKPLSNKYALLSDACKLLYWVIIFIQGDTEVLRVIMYYSIMALFS